MKFRGAVAIAAAFFLGGLQAADAVPFNADDSFGAPYDFTDYGAGPFNGIRWRIEFGVDDALDPGEDIGIKVFDDTNTLIVEHKYSDVLAGPSASFTLDALAFMQFPGPSGTVILSSLDGSVYEVASFALGPIFLDPEDLTDLLVPVNPVPGPAALPLMASALGVIGLIGWRRQRRAAL